MVIYKYLLSILIWLPIISGLLILLINKKFLSYFAVIFGIINVAVSLLLLKNFNTVTHGWQFVEYYNWLPNLGIYYALGIDGFSVLLIVLSCFVNLLILIFGVNSNVNKSQYLASLLIMSGLMNGVFAATNAILFYIFFEAMLIPLFLIVGVWGGDKRIYATIKFMIYTFLGSALFLAAIIYLHKIAINSGFSIEQSFVINNYYSLPLTLEQQMYLFLALFIAFAIKIPLVPFHTWLPDAHVAAPIEGSVMLAAITLKIGAFAMLRFLLPITIDACVAWYKFTVGLSLFSLLYISFIVLYQKNLKTLIAYSSIANMAIVTIGIFMAANLIKTKNINHAILSINGSVTHMIAHGLIAAALFLSVGVLYKRLYSNNIDDLGGIISPMPRFAKLFMIICLSNMALPGTVGFVGELLIILASFKINYIITILISLSLLLSASYTLWTYKKIIFGEPGNRQIKFLIDLDIKENIVLAGSAILILLFGIYPAPIFNIIQTATLDLIKVIT